MKPARRIILFLAAMLMVSTFVAAPAIAQKEDEAVALETKVGELYQAGKFSEAIPLARRALAIREKVRGPDHPAVAGPLNDLGMLYTSQGRYADAEQVLKRAVAIREKALGPEDLDVATSLNSLAVLYYIQGRMADAEPPYARALAIRENALGPDHPDVAASLNNLALLYDNQDRKSVV